MGIIGKKQTLIEQNKILRKMVQDLLPYARRYAHGRSDAATQTTNSCIDQALRLGIPVKHIEDPSGESILYVVDGVLGVWDSRSGGFVGEVGVILPAGRTIVADLENKRVQNNSKK